MTNVAENVIMGAVVLGLVLWSILASENRKENLRMKEANLSVKKLDQVTDHEIRSLEKRAEEIAQHFKPQYARFFEQKGYLLVCDFYRVLMNSGDRPTSDQTFEKDYASTLCLYIARPGEQNKPIDSENLYSNIDIWEMFTSFGRKRGLLTTLTPQEIRERVDEEIHRFADVLGIRLS